MSPFEITFGIEIECHIPRNVWRRLGITASWGRPPQHPELPQGWRVKTDSSLDRRAGCEPVEIVSPVLKGAEGFEAMRAVYKWLEENDVKVNQSCGTHIHAGVDMSNELGFNNVIRLSAQFEKALYASTGTKSREQGCWARSIRNEYKALKQSSDAATARETVRTRYHSLNLQNVLSGTRPTVEYRLFAGTTNFIKAAGHLFSVLGIVQKAYTSKRKQCFEVEQNKGQGENTGREAVERMVKRLKWTRNGGEGVLDASLVPAIKRELFRLADKYDAR